METFDLFEYLTSPSDTTKVFETTEEENNCEALDTSNILGNLLKGLIGENQNQALLEKLETPDYVPDINSFGGEDEAKTSSGDATDKCPVCLAPGGKHLYYGARVCLSCKGFFRRSVQNDHFPKFQCKAQGSCSVDSKSRKSCRWCRFQKCLSAGMKISWVMSGNQRRELALRKTGNEGEKHLLIRNVELGYVITERERMHLMEIYRQYLKYNFMGYIDYYGGRVDQFSKLLNCLYGTQPMTADIGDVLEMVDEHAMKNCTFNLPQMSGLTPFDKMTLIQSNFSMQLYGFIGAICFDELDLKNFFEMVYHFLKRSSQNGKMSEKSMALLEEMSKYDLSKKDGSRDHSFYNNSYIDKAEEEKQVEWRMQLQRIRKLVKKKEVNKVEAPDPIVIVLMIIIMALDPGTMALANRDKAQEVLYDHVWLLQRYLKTTYPNKANAIYHDLLMTKALAMSIYDEKKRIESEKIVLIKHY